MPAQPAASLQSHLETVIALARLLERVEGSASAPDADQYRALVEQLKTALAAELPAPALQAVLRACPAAAELYENLHYAQSGLSQQPLERSVATEMLASKAIHHAARRAA